MRVWLVSAVMFGAIAASIAPASGEATQGRVTGIGGVFVVSRHPKALAAWYHDVLGIVIQPWGGGIFRYGGSTHPPLAIWTAFPFGASEFERSHRDFMINLTVDHLDPLVARLQAKGVRILKRESNSFGRYASILDPDRTKIEFWQPARIRG